MGETLVEIKTVVVEGDHPTVSRRGGEVVIRPDGTSDVEVLLQPNDVTRWWKELAAAMADAGWADPIPTP